MNMAGYIFGITIGSIVVVMALTFCFIIYFKQRKHQIAIKKIGESAEVKINSDIQIWANHTKNKFIASSLYKYDKNKYFEVDSILVTQKGLFVIEIKSIKGKIVGGAKDVRWEKHLGTTKHFITNPVIQNEKHINHIVKMTKTKVPTISLIIFSNRADSLEIKDRPGHVAIVRHSELFNILDEIDRALPIALTNEEVRELHDYIKSFTTKKMQDIKNHKSITTTGRM